MGRTRKNTIRLRINNRSEHTDKTTSGPGRTRRKSVGVRSNSDTPEVDPVVAMFAVKEMGFEDDTAMVAGVSEQVAAVGAPVQEIETLPLKPEPGVSCKLYCAV